MAKLSKPSGDKYAKVHVSTAKTVRGGYEGEGSVRMAGKTRVTEGPAATTGCNVTSISNRRMGKR